MLPSQAGMGTEARGDGGSPAGQGIDLVGVTGHLLEARQAHARWNLDFPIRTPHPASISQAQSPYSYTPLLPTQNTSKPLQPTYPITMDALKKAAEKVTGGSSANQQVNTQPHGQPSGAGGQQDYVDKAFGAGVQKSGYNVNAGQQEKITDAGRGAFEKATGKNVPDKFSN
ncbi:hypothetical protein B0T11DRAFT_279745 [Plectosphaerella cucumerina]|uniref:Uncharacterized protein n=1 Tax=Plectosphaerella cucumerina TaxID=40658 RepID=A0A8K0TKF2_9PEZI|nr:hypothetical protein B0T11DRAFT_279745 [Plectosphaerella cucumerina]